MQGDELRNIENIPGSVYNDMLTGDAGNNELSGGEGRDTLSGGGGDDTLIGEFGTDTLTGGDWRGYLFAECRWYGWRPVCCQCDLRF